MCNSARDILICMFSDTIHACAIKCWGLEREFKEIGQNLRKFGNSKRNFDFNLWKHWFPCLYFRKQMVKDINHRNVISTLSPCGSNDLVGAAQTMDDSASSIKELREFMTFNLSTSRNSS